MKVNICGLPHEVVEVEDKFNVDCHMGMIEYKDLVIKINKDMKPEAKAETLCHEMVHGILVHLGYQEMPFIRGLRLRKLEVLTLSMTVVWVVNMNGLLEIKSHAFVVNKIIVIDIE